MAIAIGQVNANGADPKTPSGMSVVKSGNICKIFYRGEQRGNIQVTIYNENGRVVFSEVIRKKDNFMRPYNFSTLPEGTYTIALNDGQTTRLEKFAHVLNKDQRPIRLIRVNNTGNKYLLAIPNEGHDVLTISIFNDHSSLLYRATESVRGNFAKVYYLGGEGRYYFQVADQEGRINRVSISSTHKK